VDAMNEMNAQKITQQQILMLANEKVLQSAAVEATKSKSSSPVQTKEKYKYETTQQRIKMLANEQFCSQQQSNRQRRKDIIGSS